MSHEGDCGAKLGVLRGVVRQSWPDVRYAVPVLTSFNYF